MPITPESECFANNTFIIVKPTWNLRTLCPFRRQGAETQIKVKYFGCLQWNTSDCQNYVLALHNNLHIGTLVPMDFASNRNHSTFCKADLEVQTRHPEINNISEFQIITYRVFRSGRYKTNFPRKTKSLLLFLQFPATVNIHLSASKMNKEKEFIKNNHIPPFHYWGICVLAEAKVLKSK